MQILGIYLNSGDSKVIKNLKTETNSQTNHCWYPFGNIENCHSLFTCKLDKNEYKKFKNKIKEQQTFNIFLYNIEKKPYVNINCIVGKNGSGKSSLLSLEYRIINNLACKLLHYLKSYNQDFKPVWSAGFDAELYYEMNNEIYQIKVEDNTKWKIIEKEQNYIKKVSLYKINKKLEKENVLETIFSLMDNESDCTSKKYKDYENKLLTKIKKNLFYTVGTNYSLYSNSSVSTTFGTKEELWMNTIFHKNDGYFTPIVLVPYKQDNCATVDTRKELKLAKERITTLSLLVYAETKNNFVENQRPVKYCYQLKRKDVYEKEINKKLINTIRNSEKEESYVNFKGIHDSADLIKIRISIKEKWQEILFPQKIKTIYTEKLSSIKDAKVRFYIKENTLNYLSYKLLKMCMFYDEYANNFLEDSDYIDKSTSLKEKILTKYISNQTSFMNKIQDIIQDLLDPKSKTNFINLKIKQCIEFFDNLDFYIGDKNFKNLRNQKIFIDGSLKDSKTFLYFINKKITKKHLKLNYDNVFINLLPPYFSKELYFENGKTLASLSSGESQLMNSLSYAVYHIKNASSSNKIGYQSVNLVFDEAELYYHPEYQRTFIQKLIGVLSRSNLSLVKSINISIVTHSPFILSDIPDSNLLCLTKGKKSEVFSNKTLGANYYDLLHNQFFMESSIGAVAETIINKILTDFNKITNPKTPEEDKEIIRNKYTNTKQVSNKENLQESENPYITFVNNLADDYLRTTFLNMVETIRGEDFINRRKKELESKIEELENLKREQKYEQNKI